MKKFLTLLCITFFTANIIMGQSQQMQLVDELKYETPKIYKVDPRPFLKNSSKEVAKYLKAHSGYLSEAKLRKSASWGFTVGSTHTWTATNTKTEEFYDVSATCRGVGEHCYIFVEDSQWGSKVDQAAVDSIQNAFDYKTEADPNKGIYETVVEHFGEVPNVDGDSKIIILLLDIQDSFTGSGPYVAGYFHPYNEMPKASGYTNSNEAEMFYLDCNPANLMSEAGRYDALNTTAHEFQHMIHFNYDYGSDYRNGNEQSTFINEGCSLVSEVVCGYPIYNPSLFNSEPNQYLFEWRDEDEDEDNDGEVLIDYSRAARYTTYMYEQFGTQYLLNLVKTKNIYFSAIGDALRNLEPATEHGFKSTLENWHIANIANDFKLGSEYGYTTANTGTISDIHLHTSSNASGDDIEVESGGAYYISYQLGNNLTIKFDNQGNSDLKFNVVKVGDNAIELENLTAGAEYNFDDYGTTFNTLYFVVSNPDMYTRHNFSYESTGYDADVVILSYDENPPVGVLSLTTGDTVAVVFDAISNMYLDSIKVALRQAGTVRGRIYEFTGVQQPTPLGKPLTEELEITSTIAERPSAPYPNPWPNWVTIDLQDRNISVDNPFAVAIVLDGEYKGDGSGENRVMVTEQLADNIHSYTYLNNPSNNNPNWYYMTANEGTVYAYLIRAYVSLVTDVEEEVLSGLPSDYQLNQNYPNPFNPTTKINYSIPENGFVTLKIYDILGKEVATLVNTDKSVGNYEVNFNASNLSTGVYIYTLQVNNFTTSKKMMLVK